MSSLEPSLSFLLPSLHDGVELECRIYHPPHSKAGAERHRHAAIVAHPYAPLGGCYDVPVVLDITKALLHEGLVVGTLNLRGAGGSKGRTSWTGKGEVEDYESFVVFMLSYLSFLRHEADGNTIGVSTADQSSSDKAGNGESVAQLPLRLVLAGYSYGSLVVSHLPSMDDIVQGSFDLPLPKHSKVIVETARSSAEQSAEAMRQHHRKASHLRIGSGDEGSRRSAHLGRHADHILEHLAQSRRHGAKHKTTEAGGSNLTMPNLPKIEPFYLLVSPILPPLSHAIMMPLGHKHHVADAWQHHSAFAIFGDRDGFTSMKKLTPWAQEMAEKDNSRFRYAAVAGAGHFWIERGVAEKLQGAISDWVCSTLLQDQRGVAR